MDGGDWAQVYKGADTSYTDNITRGWQSVNYRVRSYDAYNATSGYTTGTAQPVNNNRAPAVSCDTASGSDLGTKDAGFSIPYSVNDEDGDPVTVTEAIDGVTLRTFSANLGGKAAVSFSKTWLPPLRTSIVQSSHTGASSLPLLVTSTQHQPGAVRRVRADDWRHGVMADKNSRLAPRSDERKPQGMALVYAALIQAPAVLVTA